MSELPRPAEPMQSGWLSRSLTFIERVGNTRWEEKFNPHRYWDTIIEVIDLARGRVITTARSDSHILYLLADGITAAYHEREGLPSLVILRLELVDSNEETKRTRQ